MQHQCLENTKFTKNWAHLKLLVRVDMAISGSLELICKIASVPSNSFVVLN